LENSWLTNYTEGTNPDEPRQESGKQTTASDIIPQLHITSCHYPA